MRFFRILTSVACLLAAASAAEIKIKVVDPQSAVVAGAQVVLTFKDSATPVAVAITSSEGLAVFQNIAAGSYHVQVLAPGFAPAATDLSPDAEIATITLRLAAAAETVVVTATGTDRSCGRRRRNVERRAAANHAADRFRRCAAIFTRRGYQHCWTTRRPLIPLRARRRLHLQQSDR